MVQMNGPTTRRKLDRPPSASEAPSLLTTSSSNEVESAAYTTSPQNDLTMAIESDDTTILLSNGTGAPAAVSDPFEFNDDKSNTETDIDTLRPSCEDIKPSHVCRACQATFTNAIMLEFHLKETHLNFHSAQRGAKPKNRHNFQFPSKLYPLSLPSSRGTDVTTNTNTTDEITNSAQAQSTHLPSQSSKASKNRKSQLYNRKRKAASPLAFPGPRRRRRKIRRDSSSPEEQKHSPTHRSLPTECVLCNLMYPSHSAWQEHAINEHIQKRNPEPKIEMNYVDIQTIMSNEKEPSNEASIITTANISGTPGRGKVQEQLKLTFCREKGNYVVKNPSFSEEFMGLPSHCDPVEEKVDVDSLLNDAGTVTVTKAEEQAPSLEITGKVIEEEDPTPTPASLEPSVEVVIEGASSPRESMGSSSSSGEINLLADKENNEPGVLGAISQNGSPGLVSKVPTSGTVVYLGSSPSESEKTLANTGNSHMVIIQNDILHIGADADEENIQRITAATTANTPQPHARKTKEVMQAVLHEELNVDKGLHKGSSIISILNMSPFSLSMNEEVTTMVSEEILNNNRSQLEMKSTVPEVLRQEGNERRTESRIDTMELRIGIGEENGRDSPTNPQSQECIQQDSPRELLPKEGSSEPSSEVDAADPETQAENRQNISEVPKSTSAANMMPMMITLPCGTQIEHLIPISPSPRRESVQSIQSEKIDVEDRSQGDNRASGPILNENVSTEKEDEEADDFRCKVCNVLFTSDEELETHFSESHFRGIANNILEPPESPYVGGPPETPLPPPPPAHTSSNGSGMLYRSMSTELVPKNFSMHGSSVASSRVERRPSDPERHFGTSDLRTNNGILTAQLSMRTDPVPTHLVMRNSTAATGGTSVFTRNSSSSTSAAGSNGWDSVPTRNIAQFPHPSHIQGGSLQSRPELQTSGSGYAMASRSLGTLQIQMQQRNQNPPPTTFRPSGMIQHSAPAQHPPSQAQPQPQTSAPKPNYPNALHNALNTVVQMQSHRPMQTPVRHSTHPQQDGPRIVDVVSIAQPVPVSRPNPQTSTHPQPQSQAPPSSQSTQQQRNHLMALHHQQRQQQYQQLVQRQQQHHEQQRAHEHQAKVAELQRQQQQAALEQQQRQIRAQQTAQLHQYNPQQQIQGKRPSQQELISSLHKQGRLDGQSQVIQDTRSRSHSIPSNVGRPDFQNPTSATTTSLLASSLGNGGVRLGTSITLSVCGDETRITNVNHHQQSQNPSPLLRTSIMAGQGQRSPNVPVGVNPNTVASALAVRGVTVSPASPTNHSSNSTDNSVILSHRLPPQLSISPNHIRSNSSPSDIPNSVSVIKNGSPQASAPSPPSHQFAMPQNPAPRIGSSVTPSDNNLSRPGRPPTVDLTADEINAHQQQQSRYLDRRAPLPGQSTASQRANRPAVACNLCGVLFCSLENLEEHKIHRHGFRPSPAPPSSQGRDQQRLPSPPLRVQQAQPQPQQARTTASTFRPPSHPGVSPRSLFIPLLDLSRMDPSRLKRLEELGVCSMIPLQGNDRALGQMGIPLLLPALNLLDGQHLPWDQLQPVGPVHSFGTRPQPLPNSANR